MINWTTFLREIHGEPSNTTKVPRIVGYRGSIVTPYSDIPLSTLNKCALT